jgi:hypothetical protein
VGGEIAVEIFVDFCLDGWDGIALDAAPKCAEHRPEMPGDESASKRARKEMKPVGTRKEVWKR